MNLSEHSSHLSEHLRRLQEVFTEEQTNRLVERCRFQIIGDRVMQRAGGGLDEKDCRLYLDVVKEMFGGATYSFARVNFLLAGCGAPKMET